MNIKPTKPDVLVVCLCGSSRFIERIAAKAWELEKGGAIALSMHLLPVGYANVQAHHQAEFEGVADAMDSLHLRKIDLADEILVVNVDGYVGASTLNEIAYALAHGKAIRWLEGDGQDFLEENAHELGLLIAALHRRENP